MVPLPDDDELRAHTEALIAAPPDIVIATTGIGFRGWIAAADGWGLATELIVALGKARIVSRGPKATGALRAAGLPEEWSPDSESSREVLHYLRRGRHRRPAHRGAVARRHRRVGSVPRVPRRTARRRAPKWCRSGCTAGIPRLATATSTSWWRASPRSKFDAVSFTSAPAVACDADARRRDGYRGPGAGRAAHRRARHVRRAGDRPPAGATRRADVGAGANAVGRVGPSHHRRAAAAAVAHHAGGRPSCWRSAAPACSSTARSRQLSPAGMATIRALAHRPGAVVSRTRLLGALPGGGTDTHAVETAVLRLRTALGRQEHRVDGGQARLSAGRR